MHLRRRCEGGGGIVRIVLSRSYTARNELHLQSGQYLHDTHVEVQLAPPWPVSLVTWRLGTRITSLEQIGE